MVAGLGCYVVRMYGSDIAKICFNNNHWKYTKGWRYQAKMGKFERLHTKNFLTTTAYDNTKVCRSSDSLPFFTSLQKRSYKNCSIFLCRHTLDGNLLSSKLPPNVSLHRYTAVFVGLFCKLVKKGKESLDLQSVVICHPSDAFNNGH